MVKLELDTVLTSVKTYAHENLIAADTAADSGKEMEEILQVDESLQTNKDDEINTALKAFWEVEHLGTSDEKDNHDSKWLEQYLESSGDDISDVDTIKGIFPIRYRCRYLRK